MGKGKRSSVSLEPPLTSADILLPNEKLLEPAPVYPQTPNHDEQDAPIFVLLTTYLSYFILIVVGHVRDFFGHWLSPKSFHHLYIKVCLSRDSNMLIFDFNVICV